MSPIFTFFSYSIHINSWWFRQTFSLLALSHSSFFFVGVSVHDKERAKKREKREKTLRERIWWCSVFRERKKVKSRSTRYTVVLTNCTSSSSWLTFIRLTQTLKLTRHWQAHCLQHDSFVFKQRTPHQPRRQIAFFRVAIVVLVAIFVPVASPLINKETPTFFSSSRGEHS